ncbi:benzoate/H(+) symporter BenE family transporter [Inhella proteolytica]|uniref:Benzoate/H(+) symporter BenE family transporter n=1 Tax=Inhella proteolytica TaxID=2795029 RepID=A0A931J307_9BURK|nr:benzoate/H(+) symporter BenE family transporter [Inhella proteolytica]MBH9577376.1 benzoate/H(+) symporter BenE family transporter [Inhella proteolytica]
MGLSRHDFPALVAGFVAVLVGFTSSVALVFQAAQNLNATPAQTASWIWALGLGTGLTSLFLSWRYRQPVLTAWSTPGSALIAAAPGLTLAEGIGAFVVCGGLIVLAGTTRGFERLMNRIPASIAASLLAGVLARFGLDAVTQAPASLSLVLGMLLAYLLGRRLWPRYAVPGVLVVGVAMALSLGQLDLSRVLAGGWAAPVWVTPVFSLNALIGLALPLFVVTMASQNLPGVAAQRAAGVTAPISPVITTTGVATLLLAPFGAFAINLAAITAAICMGREAHEDPQRRWLASASAGLVYILVGLAGGAVVALFAAFPKALVLAVAALALLGAIGNGLAHGMKEEGERDAAVLTFLVTLSGIQIAGIGAPFWAVLVGLLALLLRKR